MDEHFLFCNTNDERNGNYRDFTKPDNSETIKYLPSLKSAKNTLEARLQHIILSYRLNSRFDVPLKSLYFNIENYDYKRDSRYNIIMTSAAVSYYTIKYLKAFKKRHKNVRLFVLLQDSIHACSVHLNLVRDRLKSSIWDGILTFDRCDAKEFGFTWAGYNFYSRFDDVYPDSEQSDLYYLGFNKGGREETVLEAYNQFMQKNVKCRFDVVGKGNPEFLNRYKFEIQYLDNCELCKKVTLNACNHHSSHSLLAINDSICSSDRWLFWYA